MRAGQAPASEPIAPDRLVDIDDFGSNPGALRARLYVPAGLGSGLPLVVVLHGCTQGASGYDHGSGWSALADQHGFAVLFPEQRRSNNPNLCFNWFLPQHTQRGRGEALSIKQMVRTVQARHGIDPARIYITGLSAGGAMTSVMLATYPELFAGGAVIAGLPYGAASSMPEAFSAMQGMAAIDGAALAAKVRSASPHKGRWPAVSIWHGSDDRTVAAANGEALVEQWRHVHGLDSQTPETRKIGNVSRRSWRDGEGREVLEELVIPGMGHGTPVDPSVHGGGQSGAYMLDVGIGSAHEISRFWGIIDRASTPVEKGMDDQSRPAPLTSRGQDIAKATPRLTREDPVSSRPAESGVGKVINDALRAAGLMR
jgi:poly(hydroxyalkanoate) depolymerase family esterase